MSNPAFAAALPFVLRWEGGYVDHPADPGGATMRGVTQAVYDRWRAARGLPARAVRLLADDELHAIYEQDYWRPPRCDALAARLDLVQFDTAVNMGVRRAVRLLQQAVGAPVDGAFGPTTQRCVAGCDPAAALARYAAAREAFYRQLVAARPAMAVFLKGWLNRLDALRREVGLAATGPVRRGGGAGAGGPTRRVPDLGEDPTLDF